MGPGWATNNGYLLGVSIGILGNPLSTRYFAVRHDLGFNEDFDQVMKLLKTIGRLPIPKIGFNIGYDIGWIHTNPLAEMHGPYIDVMHASALVDERRPSYSLDNIGKWLTGHGKANYKLEQYASQHGLDSKKDMAKMPSDLVGEYACEDVNLTGACYNKLLRELRAQELQEIFKLENELIWVFYLMRKEGIRVDEEKLDQLIVQFKQIEQNCLQKIKDDWGYSVDTWAARSLEILCNGLGIDYPRTKPTPRFPSGNPSFMGGWLADHPHPALKLIAEARRYSKAHSTFLDGLRSFLHRGKIHAEFHQLKSDDGGTVTGRISMSHPGLQQMPARDKEMAKAIRGLFITSHPKRKIGSADYSQQEPRLQLHYASALKLRGADEAVKTFKENPRTDYHQMTADITGIPRSSAKIINLGLAYGMGVRKLAASLGIAYESAQEKLNNYYQRLPWLKELQIQCGIRAAERGWIKTLLGRRCRYNQWEPVNKELFTQGQYPVDLETAQEQWVGAPLKRAFTYRGMNGLIQGSAGDQTKKAMRDLYYDHNILANLQMHDELIFEVSNQKELESYAQVMRDTVKLAVPVIVDTAVGKSWGEIT
jgi:DNA polymerase I-like protein with 3'-5' exonuclease and polymerase domains